MIYVFCDEDIRNDGQDLLYRYAAVAFFQRRYNNRGFHRIEGLREGGRSLLNRINEVLGATGGFALVSEASVPEKEVPAGKTLSTNDIPEMSFRDFTWSVSMILTVACLIPELLGRLWSFKTADIYYDPKSLTKEHTTAVEWFLQNRVKQQVRRLFRNANVRPKVNVRRVMAVSKPKRGDAPGKFQLGTWIADRIVKRFDQIPDIVGESFVKTIDLTQHVNDTLNDLGKLTFASTHKP